MANTFNTSDLIAKSVSGYHDVMGRVLPTANQKYVGSFHAEFGQATGLTVNVKNPGFNKAIRGLDISSATVQDLSDFVTPITLSKTKDVASMLNNYDSIEEALQIAGGEKSLTKAQVNKMAPVIDEYGYENFTSLDTDLQVRCVETLRNAAYITPIDEVSKLGSLDSYDTVQDAMILYKKMDMAQMNPTALLNVEDAGELKSSLKNVYNEPINTKILKESFISNIAGADVMESSVVFDFDGGALANESSADDRDFTLAASNPISDDGYTLNAALGSGQASVTDVYKAGDRISIPGMTLVTPIYKNVLKTKLVVTVAEDASSDSSGNVSIKISHPLLASGKFANVDSLPGNSEACKVFPPHKVNFIYNKSGLSAIPLPLNDIHGATCSIKKVGTVPIMVWIQGDIKSGVTDFRILNFVGLKAFPQWCVSYMTTA